MEIFNQPANRFIKSTLMVASVIISGQKKQERATLRNRLSEFQKKSGQV
jgi:hypothetical protein